jgi:hypothetical protein
LGSVVALPLAPEAVVALLDEPGGWVAGGRATAAVWAVASVAVLSRIKRENGAGMVITGTFIERSTR